MRNETDIIDWYVCPYSLILSLFLLYSNLIFRAHSVTGLPYDPKVTPTPDQYSKMLEMSPIVHARKVNDKEKIHFCIFSSYMYICIYTYVV